MMHTSANRSDLTELKRSELVDPFGYFASIGTFDRREALHWIADCTSVGSKFAVRYA